MLSIMKDRISATAMIADFDGFLVWVFSQVPYIALKTACDSSGSRQGNSIAMKIVRLPYYFVHQIYNQDTVTYVIETQVTIIL